MFLIKAGSLFLILSVERIFIKCEDKETIFEELPEPVALHQVNENDSQMDLDPFSLFEIPDLSNLQKKIQDDLEKMRERMNSEMMKPFDEFPDITIGKIPQIISIIDDDQGIPKHDATTKSEPKKKQQSPEAVTEGEPGVVIEKASDHPMTFNRKVKPEPENNLQNRRQGIDKLFDHIDQMSQPSNIFDDQPFVLIPIGDVKDSKENPGEITFIGMIPDVDDTDLPEVIPFQETFHITIPNDRSFPNEDTNGVFITSEEISPGIKGFMDDFVRGMKNMFEVLQKATPSVFQSRNESSSTTKTPTVDIKIKDHGSFYDVPSDAYQNRVYPGSVNITWNSGVKNVNNSLYLKASKDGSDHIVFQHAILRLYRDRQMHEFTLAEPMHVKGTGEADRFIQLSDGVEVHFLNPDSLKVIIEERGERFSTHWLAFSVAVLGLIVAGLIMLLSYIMHTKHKQLLYERKDSMAKEPIA